MKTNTVSFKELIKKNFLPICVSVGILFTSVGAGFMAQAASRVSLPIDFETTNPITDRIDVYGGAEHLKTNSIEAVGGEYALNGNYSLKFTIPDGNARTYLQNLEMAGISDFSKSDFSKVTGLMMRIKIIDDSTSSGHKLRMILLQNGLSNSTNISKNVMAYDKNGNFIAVLSDDISLTVPSNFDGFLFFSLADARSEHVTVPGKYDSYLTYPNQLVDLSKDFKLRIAFYDNTWNSTSIILDDLSIYSGSTPYDHLNFLKNELGYSNITAVAQPVNYPLPLNFDEGYEPFSSISNVVNNSEIISNTGFSYNKDDALNGIASFKIENISSENQRTYSGIAKIAGLTDFNKTDFKKTTGILIRMKLVNDSSEKNHNFAINLTQTGLSPTRLAKDVIAYDNQGNQMALTSDAMMAYIPPDFDGFLFFAFENAHSQHVTTPGKYDRYDTYPNSMVDLSENFNLQFLFYDNTWNGLSIIIDDIATYSGSSQNDHFNALYNLGYTLTAVAQPDKYTLPLAFDEQYNPFISVNNVYDAAEHWTENGIGLTDNTEEVLNGSYSLKIDNIKEGNSRTETTHASMSGNALFNSKDFSKLTGIMMRIKISEDTKGQEHQFSLRLLQDGLSPTCLGSGAVLYYSDGKKATIKKSDIVVYLPAGFDGFVFFPLETAQSLKITIPGKYDSYATYPDSMVDLSKDYKMYMYMYGDSWGGCKVYVDDINFYSGASHGDHLNTMKSLGYNVTAVAQPSAYSLPIVFDDMFMPFTGVNNIYDNKEHQTNEGVKLIEGTEALNGSKSVKISSVNSLNTRTQLNEVKMSPVSGFSTSCFNIKTGIMLRIKIAADIKNQKHILSLRLFQNGKKQPTVLGNNARIYDLNGNAVSSVNRDLGAELPSGFDGFVFFPFENAQSLTITVKGKYDSYATYPENMVDLSEDFSMIVYFQGDSWNGCNILLDDFAVYSGNEHNNHIDTIKQLGYKNVTAVPQPSRYSFPMIFDDGIMPFNAVNDIYDNALHWKNSGVGLVSGSEALEGSKSVKVNEISSSNSRTELNYINMAGIENFNYKNFSDTTGIMMRVKISNDNSGKNHPFGIGLRQTGVKEVTWLGCDAIAYDLSGNKLSLQSNALYVNLPAEFDGYVFFSFEKARSLTVTVPGKYDSYETYPESMVDISKDYQMYFGFMSSNWGGCTITFDDMRIYSGNQYVNILKKYYKGIKTVQQPEYYNFPLTFETGMTPFTSSIDQGIPATKGIYGTGGILSYRNTEIGNRTGMVMDFAENLDGAVNMYTSLAPFKGNSGAKGILIRLKTNAKESATFAIRTDPSSPDIYTLFGTSSILYDMNGNQVDHPYNTKFWAGCSLPENFDGFVFIPYEKGYIEKRNKFIKDIDGWSFDSIVRQLQFLFYGEEEWAGSQLEIDYIGEYYNTQYIQYLESLGFELDYSSALINHDILGEAADKFFYVLKLSEAFDQKALTKLNEWEIVDAPDSYSLSGHYIDNVSLNSGSLGLSYKKKAVNGQNYTAGAVRSRNSYSYGYYEASIKIPKLSGTKTAFSLVTEGDFRQGGMAFNVDIAYLNSLYQLETGYAYMEDGVPESRNGKIIEGKETVNTKDEFYNNFHTYGLLYTYNYLRYYVDGVLVRTVKNTFARGAVNIELSTSVTDEITEVLTEQNSTAFADYVRYWEINQEEMALYDTDDAEAPEATTVEKEIKTKYFSNNILIVASVMTAAAVICYLSVFIFSYKKKKQ